GDHVAEHDEVERGVPEGQLLGVGLPVRDAPRLRSASRFLDHAFGEIDAYDLGVRIAPGGEPRSRPGARAEVEHMPWARRKLVQRGAERRERVRAAHRVPLRRDAIELALHRPAEQTPEPGTADDHVGGEAREALPERHGPSTCSSTRWPWCAENISAALPRLMAIATLRYESS